MELIIKDTSELRALLREEIEGIVQHLNTPPERERDFGWVSNSEAQSMRGLSRATLQRYRSGGILPHSRIGANIYYKLEDIKKLLEKNLRTASKKSSS